ncbi:MAG: hypothetical protein MHM6MM_000928 [Cercozoa sp. M6MM]
MSLSNDEAERDPLSGDVHDFEEEGPRGNSSESVPRLFSRSTYASLLWAHSAEFWCERMWQFFVPLALLEAFPETLQHAALLETVVNGSLFLFGPSLGRWVDKVHRKHAVRRLAPVAALGMTACCALVLVLLEVAKQTDKTGVLPWKNWRFALSFLLLLATCAVGRLALRALTIALEKDWLPLMCQLNHWSVAHVNAQVRRLDVTCDLLAPVVSAALLSLLGVETTTAVVAIMNILAAIPATLISSRVVSTLPEKMRGTVSLEERIEMELDQLVDEAHLLDGDSDGADDTDHYVTQASAESGSSVKPSSVESAKPSSNSWRLFSQQSVLLQSLSFCLLFLTVLQPSGIMAAYLMSEGMTAQEVAAARAVKAVLGISATAYTPWLIRKLNLRTTTLSALLLQALLAAGGTAVCFWTDTSPWLLVSLIALSRASLWTADLCHVEVMQRFVAPAVANQVNGTQMALASLLALLASALAVVLHKPEDFPYLALISTAAMSLSFLFSLAWFLRKFPHISQAVALD